MSEKHAVVKAAMENRKLIARGEDAVATSVPGEKAIIVSCKGSVFRVNHPEDYIPDDVDYRVVSDGEQYITVVEE